MDPVKHERERAVDEEEEVAFLPGSRPRDTESDEGSDVRRSRKLLSWARIAAEVLMALAIVALLFRPTAPKRTWQSMVPDFPMKTYTFRQDPKYMNKEMFYSEIDTLHTLHNWIPLSSDSRGYVKFDDYTQYPDLPKPYQVQYTPFEDGPGFMMTVYHQLHCLSYLVTHYQQGYAGVNLTDEVAHHTAHCFDYIRQGIMCAADTNLEGNTEAGPGEGSPHLCRDYDAVLEWANQHAALRWKNRIMPDTAIL